MANVEGNGGEQQEGRPEKNRNFRPGKSPFDEIRHVGENPDGSPFEHWSAREAMEPLGYADWRNMENVARKARISCRSAGQDPGDHFVDINEMIQIGKGAFRRVTDIQMSRFGMYLLAMNGDPEKPQIAAAQQYFAIQTHRAEQLLPPAEPTPRPAAETIIGTPRPWAERFRETFMPHVRDLHQRHPGCFSVVSAAATEILVIEDEIIRHLMTTRGFDRPDISFGMRYAVHRREAGMPEPTRTARLYLPQQAIDVEVRVYEGAEWPFFSTFFRDVYLPEHLGSYLNRKPELQAYAKLTKFSVADNTSRALSGKPASGTPTIQAALAAVGGFAPARPALPG